MTSSVLAMLGLRVALAAASTLTVCLGAPRALATEPARAGGTDQGAPRIGGFELLASAGYGADTATARDLELSPYGVTFALDAGYTFPAGPRLGAYVGYGLGGNVRQRRDGVLQDFEFSTESSALSFAASVGYDVPLHFFVLRYGLLVGGTSMQFELHDVPPASVLADAGDDSPATGFMVAPGAALLLPRGRLQCGIGFDYMVQAHGGIPPAFLAKLLLGVRL